jgi:putative ABC transport system ATP-binding protein
VAAAQLQARDLTVEYGSGGYRIRPLDGLNLSAYDGELVVLLGPSGCGKTTLLSCLAGLLTPTKGTIRFGQIEVEGLVGRALADYRRHTVGTVFQAFNLVKSLNARENVMAPLLLAGTSRRRAKARADELLDRVALGERAHHRPSGLSGGQQQRVAIARALVNEPPLLLADEPTAHLDHIQVEGILRLLRELAAPGRVLIVSTHDDRVTRLADRVVEMTPRAASPTVAEPVELTLGEGELLFAQGDRSELVYMVDEGSVSLYRVQEDTTEELITVIRAGQYFGELGPLLGTPRSASARASEPTRLTGYPIHEFSRRFPNFQRLVHVERLQSTT